MRNLTAFLLALFLAPSAAVACSALAVCGDVGVSFTGGLEVSGVLVSWSSDSEPASGVTAYKLYRCTDAENCSLIQTLPAIGDCGTEEPYIYFDSTEGELYRLAVMNNTQQVCSYDTVPE